MNSPSDHVRVFVAATEGEWLPMQVLAHSLRETSALSVGVHAIRDFGRNMPLPRHHRNMPRTPFSFQRFLIPELCNFQGRALYLDADMLVLHDVANLWNRPMGEHEILTVRPADTSERAGQFSVMLLDCARLSWHIEDIVQGLDEDRYTYEQLMYGMCIAGSVGRTIEAGWNSLERYASHETRLLHYTDMHRQPWVARNNPLAHLWVACMRRALAAGSIHRQELVREVQAGHVRPSLLAQVDLAMDDPRDLPRSAVRADRIFRAPYERLPGARSRPVRFIRGVARAMMRAVHGTR